MREEERLHTTFQVPGWQAKVHAEIGHVRERMEDSWAIDLDAELEGEPMVLAAVFDGLGGLAAGDAAAQAAATAASEALTRAGLDGLLGSLNERVIATGGGTTAVVAVFPRNVPEDAAAEGWLLSVGDSSAYTLDTQEDDVVRRTERDSVSRHVLSDFLGRPGMEGHMTPIRLGPDESLVLCTDGVDEVVGRETLGRLFARSDDLDRSIRTVFDKVVIRGAPDNATLLVLRRTRS